MTTVRIPADVEREDRIVLGLTWRQLGLLAVLATVLYSAYQATAELIAPLVFLVGAAPIGVVAATVIIGRRDGLPLYVLAAAALRHTLRPRIRRAVPDPVPAPPRWLAEHATDPHGQPLPRRPQAVGPLEVPAREVSRTGIIDLGGEGLAMVAACGTVNFALRTPQEQAGLIGVFGRYLHSLSTPVQVLIRAERLDLSAQIEELRAHAAALPHPALEAAALEHADYLTQLGQVTDLLRRQVLLVLREPLPLPARLGAGVAALAMRRRRRAELGEVARRGAEVRLSRRLDQARSLLAAAGIPLRPLDARQATAVLARACNPGTRLPAAAERAHPAEVITTGSHP
ncbi:PrgI family protein [Crossiella sp. SN42]|uniref:PrgI family protein n=1 Tax=Crossiella sp. SN42 TaxID=2944808 RepID=UPI00207D158E|nr:PrgI family protein [Crossiella sp. SN42]MCO1575905.1 PrgI family protein [Crossiella sp. SN42]